MAEILIRLGDQDAGNPSAFKDGDIVCVCEDGHAWGPGESKPAWLAAGNRAADWPAIFFILKVPIATTDRINALLTKKADAVRQRMARVDYSALDLSSGVATLNFAQAKAIVSVKT
jgi:hypothetical protein